MTEPLGRGEAQRRALTAVQQAIRALGAGEPQRARDAAARAAELDQLGVYASLVPAVAAAVADIERDGAVGADAWDAVAAAVGPGPLAIEVDTLRG